jgi:hypothetical protein
MSVSVCLIMKLIYQFLFIVYSWVMAITHSLFIVVEKV